MIRRVAACLAVASLVACGAPAATVIPSVPPTLLEAWPEGFSTEYGLVFEMPFSNEPYTEGPFTDAFLISERVTLVGADGTTAGTGVLTALDYRPTGETVVCDGVTYEGELAHDLADPPGGFEGELTDGTTIELVPDRQVVVYVGDTQPTCFQHGGTYTVTFTGDPGPRIKTGRYTWIGGSLDLD